MKLLGLFALFKIPKHFLTKNEIDRYLGVEKRKSENAKCKKCKQREQDQCKNLE